MNMVRYQCFHCKNDVTGLDRCNRCGAFECVRVLVPIQPKKKS